MTIEPPITDKLSIRATNQLRTAPPLPFLRVALVPLDRLVAAIGPRYRSFLWLVTRVHPRVLATLGRWRAARAVDHARRRVPAYRTFLKAHDVSQSEIRALRLPETDKDRYVRAHSLESRCLDGRLPTRDVAIDESSGSTGIPYNWIRTTRERVTSHIFISHFARYCFGRDPMITINAFSMGAWATGVNMGIALQRNGIVKNTGPDLDKILSTLEFLGSEHRYLICGYPPFLKHVIDASRERGFPLHEYSLMGLVGGEGMSEGLRDYLNQVFSPVYSGFGATDLEIGIAGETPLSVAIRQTARRNEALQSALFGADSRLPMIFQYNPLNHHVVVNKAGELIYTINRLEVLSPRIMYNVHDEGGVATFVEMEGRFRSVGEDLGRLVDPSMGKTLRLPFLWVYGRKDSTASVMGANIYPEDVERALYDEPDLAAKTHSFCLGLVEDEHGAVRPCFSFEIHCDTTDALTAEFEARITERIRTFNADFREAMKEHPTSVRPVVQLFALGDGPFAADATKIKQTRVVELS
ncbi:MAG: phenylacetate--CoA ligase family protein [Actinomycetota bacterium]